jgi:hypothetical protein
MTHPPPDEMRRAIRQAFAEIDPRQIAIWREMPPERRNQIINSVISAARQMAIESEQQRHPDLAPDEIHRRAMARFMRKSEWEPGLWKAVFGPDQPTENEDT